MFHSKKARVILEGLCVGTLKVLFPLTLGLASDPRLSINANAERSWHRGELGQWRVPVAAGHQIQHAGVGARSGRLHRPFSLHVARLRHATTAGPTIRAGPQGVGHIVSDSRYMPSLFLRRARRVLNPLNTLHTHTHRTTHATRTRACTRTYAPQRRSHPPGRVAPLHARAGPAAQPQHKDFPVRAGQA